jgi:hypothetical protein
VKNGNPEALPFAVFSIFLTLPLSGLSQSMPLSTLLAIHPQSIFFTVVTPHITAIKVKGKPAFLGFYVDQFYYFTFLKSRELWDISGFHRSVGEAFVLLRCYAT